jgi:hypothetical protein
MSIILTTKWTVFFFFCKRASFDVTSLQIWCTTTFVFNDRQHSTAVDCEIWSCDSNVNEDWSFLAPYVASSEKCFLTFRKTIIHHQGQAVEEPGQRLCHMWSTEHSIVCKNAHTLHLRVPSCVKTKAEFVLCLVQRGRIEDKVTSVRFASGIVRVPAQFFALLILLGLLQIQHVFGAPK